MDIGYLKQQMPLTKEAHVRSSMMTVLVIYNSQKHLVTVSSDSNKGACLHNQ